ncbi:MAG: hypothetical protein K2X27_23420 [Candidatus Obscuribacterales bacterium]|nr:hypothetical protein [Candidatus Obscuribacterales bacterium]
MSCCLSVLTALTVFIWSPARADAETAGQTVQAAPATCCSQGTGSGDTSSSSTLLQPSSSSRVDLDLSSTQRSIQVNAASPVNVQIGGAQTVITPGDYLTPAQFVAAQQFLSGGPVLQVGALGNAVGGTLVLNSSLSHSIGNLVVPQGVTAVRDFADGTALNLAGNLTNAGNFYALSSSQAVSSATIASANIANLAGANLTSVLPAGGLPGFTAAISQLNLNLTAINNIINHGNIASSGSLSMTAGGSIVNTGNITAAQNVALASAIGSITNSGLIAAAAGNININNNININSLTASLAINNAGGTLKALNGSINFRDSIYTGSGDLNLIGGDYLSQEINLYTGTGTATVSAGQLTGSLNTAAGAEHVAADTSVLKLGNHCITGDPTYYNTGSIEIIGTVSSNENLAIIAGGDITSDANGQIVTNGHELLMIAGAKITSSCIGCTTPGPGTVGPSSGVTPTSGLAEGPVTVSLTGGNGGNIDLSSSLAAKVIDTSSSSGSGGNVNVIALADAFGLKGEVKLNSGSNLGEINSSGAGAGGGGNVTIYAGSSFLGLVTSISTNKIVTVSNGTSNSGNVTLQTTQAVTSDNQPLVLNAQGSITSGNTIQAGATLAQAGIKTGMIDTHIAGGAAAGGNVNIKAYGDVDTSAGVIYTINNGVGVSGEINLTSTNGAVSTAGIYSFVYSGWLAASNVTIRSYGDITTNSESIYTFQGGSGVGGTIDLRSSNGNISTGLIVTGVGDATAAGNVIMSAYGSISALSIFAFNAGTGGGGSVALTSSNGSISTGSIATNTNLGLLAAGNVSISAYDSITILGAINASNSGIGAGGNVTLLTQGALTTSDINTSSVGFIGGAITAASKGDNGIYSIAMGNLNSSGSAAAGSVEIVSTDILEKGTLIGKITAQASGQNGVGGAVGIATRGSLAIGNIDTINTSTSTVSGAQSGSVFLSSGSTAADAISVGSITAYNSANGSATGQVILIASGTISSGAITTSVGNSSVNPNFTSLTPFISSSTTVDVSVSGIAGLLSNYNPQGYLWINGSSTQLSINSGGNSSLLAPLLCLSDVSIDSINSNNGTQADGVSLAASGNITLSGTNSVNTAGTTSGGNVNLLSIGGQIDAGALVTNSAGAGPAGNVNLSANGSISVGGALDASNIGSGAGGTVTLISNNSSVSLGEVDTFVSAGSGAAGSVSISAYGAINTNSNAIAAFNSGTGAGGKVTLVSSTDSIVTGTIASYVSGGTTAAGSVSITALKELDSSAVDAHNADRGASGQILLVSSTSDVTVGALDTYVIGGTEKAADVTISAYGSVVVNGALSAYNTGTGSGCTVNLLSANGSITTKTIDVNVNVDSIVAGNVNIEASKFIDTSAGTVKANNGSTRPIDSGVTFLSHNSSITTGSIDISVTGGSATAGNVSLAAAQSITVNGTVNASNVDSGSGGTVTLESTKSSVAVSRVDTHVASSSAQAGSVSILAAGSISASGAIDATNTATVIGTGNNGAAGPVTLISTGSINTVAINTYVSGGPGLSGNVTILADGSIAAGVINASNSGTGAGGAIALTSQSGTVTLGGIQTQVSGGSAAAGNLIVSAPGAIAITGAIATNNSASGAGGSVALISNSTISSGSITTSGMPSGSVFLSSGHSGTGAIVTGAIAPNGGPLLATAASSGSIIVQSFADGNSLSVNGGQIYATGTYASAVTILPRAFANAAAVTITPAIIPGGGFTSFTNSGTITLANDAGSSGNVITFSNLIPAFVQGSVSSLGTINDSTGRGDFFLMSPSVSVSSASTYSSTSGSLNILAGILSLGDINTSGVNLKLTAVQAMSVGAINTINSGGTKAGNATLLSVIGSVTSGKIDSSVTSGSAPSGNVTISAYGNLSTNSSSINTSNSGTGAGGTVNLTTSGTGSVKLGQISTGVTNATSNAAAGNITIFSAGAIDMNSQAIDSFNSGAGAGGTVTLTSNTYSVATADIDTHAASGSAPAGNVFLSALQDISAGNINSSHGGTGTGGSVTLVRAAAMKTGDINSSSSGFTGGSIIAAAVGDNSVYSLKMGNLNTSGLTAAGSVMLVADDFGDKPSEIGNITAQASGASGVGGAVGVATLGKLTIGNIDTSSTAATTSGAKSGSVFLSSGLAPDSLSPTDSIVAGSINAYNSTNGSATGQVILIASGSIKTAGAITTSAGSIPAQTFTTKVLSGTEASVNPNYSSNTLSISSSTTVKVSVTEISSASSNFNPQGYAALSGSNTELTVDSGGNSSLLAPLVFTAYVPMLIKSIKSADSAKADGIALVILGNLILSDGISASGTVSGGNVVLQSSAGEISANYIDTHSSGAGAAGSVNITTWGVIPISGGIDASNTGTGAGGSVFLATTTDALVTGEIKTSVAGGSAAAGNVGVSAFQSLSTKSIDASNNGTGAGGTVFLMSSDSSVASGAINSSAASGASGNVFISAYGSIDLDGNIQAGSVTLNAGGNIEVNPGLTAPTSISSSGSQTYNGALFLYTNTSLASTNSTVTFNKTVDGSKDLTISSGSGAIDFSGNVGGINALGQLILTGNGTSTFAGTVKAASLSTSTGTNNINGGKITTTGNQTYNGNLVLGGDTTLKADGIITLNASLNDNNANRLLQFAAYNNTSVKVVNNASLSLNGANSIIGFNRGVSGSIDMSGTGSLNASQVNFGNLNPNTLQIFAPFVIVSPFTGSYTLGNISINQAGITGTLQVAEFIPPPPAPSVPSTPSLSPGTNSIQLSYFSYMGAALLASSTGRFPFSDLVPTDLTRSRGYGRALTELEDMDIQTFLSGQVTNEQEEEVAIFAGTSFDTQALQALSRSGVALGSGSRESAITLNRGTVLFAPKSNIVVTTKEGDVHIAAGSIVLVFEDGNDSAVLNVSDAKQGDVKVRIGSSSHVILPGEELVMTRSSSGTFTAVNPARTIAHRGARKAKLGEDVSAYLCEFSLVSALSNTGLYDKLRKDDSLKPVLKQILLTAASLQTVTGARGPYKQQQ